LSVGFCINADGDFLKPIVIKKGKTKKCLESLKCPDSMQTCFSNNGWINNGIMIILFDIINKHSENNESVLLLDQYSVHTNDFVIDEAKKRKIKLIFIPARLTYKYQPLDVGINGPLKSAARKLWKEERISDPEKTPKLSDAVRHIASAIKNIINDTIVKKSFRRALDFLWPNENE
jgi:hypothetical protein